MRPDFHARYSASLADTATTLEPTKRHARHSAATSVALHSALDRSILDRGTSRIVGDHCFVAFAVRGTAPDTDDHRCIVHPATWRDQRRWPRLRDRGQPFSLTTWCAFLVGTLIEAASGKRNPDAVECLLAAQSNDGVSPPAPAHGLFLDRVTYPPDLYLQTE